MRKIISVLLVALMLFSVMAVSASAAVCSCGRHEESKGAACQCCVDCPELDVSLRFDCAKLEGDHYTTCCTACKGFSTGTVCYCNCGCATCGENESTGTDFDSIKDQVWGEEQQNNFVDGFQAILKKISDAFDNFFDKIFEFLRLDEVLGIN